MNGQKIEDFVEHQIDWDEFLRADDTMNIAFALRLCFDQRPNGDRRDMADAALKEWTPAPCRLELPN